MNLAKNLFGKLFGDKGYIIRPELFEKLYELGIQLITKLRANMKNKLMELDDKLMLSKRGVVESSIRILKEILSIEHTRHRSKINGFAHLLSGLAAYFFYPSKPSIIKYDLCSLNN